MSNVLRRQRGYFLTRRSGIRGGELGVLRYRLCGSIFGGGSPLRQDLSTSKGLGTQNSVSALTHETTR